MRGTQYILVWVFVFMLIGCFPAHAQNWWNKAKDILHSDTAQKALDEIVKTDQINSMSVSSLSDTEVSAALKEALQIGTQKVVKQLGSVDGFNLDPRIHIPLPNALSRVDNILSRVGLDFLGDDLELRLNRAAEVAMPKAKELFIHSIQEMSIEDAKNILSGPENAATQYFRTSMGPGLSKEMKPIVHQALSEAGAIKAYDAIMGEYSEIPFMPDVKANLNDYVLEKALDGIFYYIGKEEAAIKANPAARTTDLLKRVFKN